MIKDCFVVCGMLAAFLAGSQANEVRDQRQDVAAPESSSWPPRPENIVNLSGPLDFNNKRTQVPVYKVPPGKTLVVTLLKTTVAALDLLEHRNGRDELKLHHLMMHRSSNEFPGTRSPVIGLTFAPRSLVILREVHALRGKFYYHVRGYLIPTPEPVRKK